MTRPDAGPPPTGPDAEPPRLRPLEEFDARGVHGVLTDLDDTLSTDGRLDPEAFAAMNRLRQAGLRVVPVTGRSAGWCDHFVRMWPVDAVIGETGAFYMLRQGGGVRTVFTPGAEDLHAARTRREAIAAEVLREVPEAALAGDQPYRLIDLAIDVAEAVPPVAPARVARIVEILRAHGMHAQTSSIHVNAWFGEFDKGRTARKLLAEQFGESDDDARDRWVCVGDAPNDAPLFAAFRNSVGVANLLARADRMPVLPRWITRAPSGAGFAELAAHLLAAR
ncbi:HAD-IIB family hydrolase [Burkholderiaceae bacterium FT117]|uniref:HAD-IIB family hydrolase n=1 Tax=Zeimonas sediminis TaxID=2944268 RepID=UPI002342CF3D|nr:HAD-IIB family hydrolase [Zeimonas sediminis]MCM5570381.1 HAD-IIB family hydrolase [Zeimonas sediminis]